MIAVKNRLNSKISGEIGQYQCGFRQNRSVMVQVFVLKQTIENRIEQNFPLYLLFIQFFQFEEWRKSNERNGCGSNLQLVKMTLNEMMYKILENRYIYEEVIVKGGLQQGVRRQLLCSILYQKGYERANY